MIYKRKFNSDEEKLAAVVPVREQLKAVKTVVVHKDCPDGWASAIIVKDVLLHVEVIFCQYSTEQHKKLEAKPNMLFVDFSPPAERVQEFVDAGSIVLDHHKTAKAVVEAFGDNGVFGDETTDPGTCGATLAYKCVWKVMLFGKEISKFRHDKIKSFVELAGVRDCWLRDHPAWRQACEQREMLLFYDDWMQQVDLFTWNNSGHGSDCEIVDRMRVGTLLLSKWEREVQRKADEAYRFTSAKGTRVVVFQDTKFSSDVAELVGSDADLVVAFSYKCENDNRPRLIFSTRSHTSFDCAAFAKQYGGGGHTKAAGFSCDDNVYELSPYVVFRMMLSSWENQ